MAEDEDDEQPQPSADGKAKKLRECQQPQAVQDLIKLIFDHDMFKQAMKQADIDTEKLPLGKLDTKQLQKGFKILEEIKEEVEGRGRLSVLQELSSRFYTTIPHSFGMKVPPALKEKEQVQQKMDLLEVLTDICTAQKLMKQEVDPEAEEVDHPIDVNYNKLKNPLKPLDRKSKEFGYIEKFIQQTGPKGPKLLEVFELAREGEEKRAEKHKDITNRKLLWHGTNVAVMVAILSGGLRIMPHSGGRVGRGLYFASEMSKSSGYVCPAQGKEGQIGLMLLNEVALGKEHSITRDDSSLTKAPQGFDSVVARGNTEVDPSEDVHISGAFGDVVVPQGKVKNTNAGSSFLQSEYLVYQESQVQMRYLLKFKWY